MSSRDGLELSRWRWKLFKGSWEGVREGLLEFYCCAEENETRLWISLMHSVLCDCFPTSLLLVPLC